MTECNKSVYLANRSIDMIDAVNKGYEYGYNKAIDDFVKALCIEYAPVSDEMQEAYDNVCSRFERIAEQLKDGGENE